MPLQTRDEWDSEFPVWNTVLSGWALQTTGYLNRTLPRDTHRAYLDVISGFRIGLGLRDSGGPPPARTVPTFLPDVCEVHVFEPSVALRPVAVIAFVRPPTKAEPNRRAAFVRNCTANLQRGVAVVVIDVVDVGMPSVNDDVLESLGASALGAPLSVVGYRAVLRDSRHEIDVWPYPAVIGQPIPAVPLALRGGPVVLLDLESNYAAAIDATGL